VLAALAADAHATPLGLGAAVGHAATIGDQAGTLAARTIVPVGAPPRAAVLVAAGVVGALGVWAACSGPILARRAARRPLVLLAVGVVVVVAGYAMVVFAAASYQPDDMGLSNRINVAAAPGYAAIAVALAWILVDLVGGVLPRPPWAGALAGVLVTGLVVAGGASQVLADASDWNHAWSEQKVILASLYRLVPAPAPGTTVFTFGRSGYTAPSVPIFGGGGNNDMLGAVRLLWGSSTVRGFPVLDEMHLECATTTVSLSGTKADSTTRYGRALFVELRRDLVVVPRDQAACRRVANAQLPYAPVNERND
jgi:hypothetical protein